MIEQVGE